MAYYSKVSDHKSRDQKRRQAEQRGGFEDEGSNYSGAKKSKSTAAPGKRSYSKPQKDGEPRTYTRKPADGNTSERKSYGKPTGEARSFTRKPADGNTSERKSYGKPTGEARSYTHKPADGNTTERRSYGKPTGDARSYTRKPADGNTTERRSYGRPTGEARSYTRKPEDGSAPARKPYGKPVGGESRPYARKSANGDAPARRGYGRPADGGEQRFAAPSGQTGRSRGDHITPRPYAEQKRDQRFNENRPAAPAFRAQPPVEEAVAENLLSGRNPIREALKSGRDMEKLLVAKGELSGSAKEIVAMAKERHIPVQEVDRVRLDAITQNHQGMLAYASAYKYHSVDEMLALAKSKGEQPFLVMLDGVTDPHNLGAVIRTAECAGAHGVIVQERRAVGLTPAAVKASAGAIEHIMVARVVNLTATLDMLKKLGVWAYAADPKGEDYLTVDFSGGAVIVIGAEGEGVSRLVLEKCDQTVALPMRGQIGSLNASVAAGILLYTVLRSR